jgi:hypothetical protein
MILPSIPSISSTALRLSMLLLPASVAYAQVPTPPEEKLLQEADRARLDRLSELRIELAQDPAAAFEKGQRVSEYWLGLSCSPASAALRAQLGLGEREGLIVDDVLPESPAQQAGLAPYDVLLNALDFPLEAVEDLNHVVGLAKDQKPIAIDLIRAGKRQRIEARAARRPENVGDPERARSSILRWLSPRDPRAALVLEHPQPLDRVAIDVLHPGLLLEAAGVGEELPEDVEVTVRKRGKAEPEVVVRQGDKEWRIEDGKRPADLPEDLWKKVRGLALPDRWTVNSARVRTAPQFFSRGKAVQRLPEPGAGSPSKDVKDVLILESKAAPAKESKPDAAAIRALEDRLSAIEALLQQLSRRLESSTP